MTQYLDFLAFIVLAIFSKNWNSQQSVTWIFMLEICNDWKFFPPQNYLSKDAPLEIDGGQDTPGSLKGQYLVVHFDAYI